MSQSKTMFENLKNENSSLKAELSEVDILK